MTIVYFFSTKKASVLGNTRNFTSSVFSSPSMSNGKFWPILIALKLFGKRSWELYFSGTIFRLLTKTVFFSTIHNTIQSKTFPRSISHNRSIIRTLSCPKIVMYVVLVWQNILGFCHCENCRIHPAKLVYVPSQCVLSTFPGPAYPVPSSHTTGSWTWVATPSWPVGWRFASSLWPPSQWPRRSSCDSYWHLR